MAGSVEEVKTFLPKVLASQNINCKATGSLGKDRCVNSNHTLEDQGECPLLELSWLAKVEGPSGIGRSIEILATRVAEIDGCGVDDRAATLLRLVVNNGTVGTSGRNGVE